MIASPSRSSASKSLPEINPPTQIYRNSPQALEGELANRNKSTPTPDAVTPLIYHSADSGTNTATPVRNASKGLISPGRLSMLPKRASALLGQPRERLYCLCRRGPSPGGEPARCGLYRRPRYGSYPRHWQEMRQRSDEVQEVHAQELPKT
jgi:hypothetical protein